MFEKYYYHQTNPTQKIGMTPVPTLNGDFVISPNLKSWIIGQLEERGVDAIVFFRTIQSVFEQDVRSLTDEDGIENVMNCEYSARKGGRDRKKQKTNSDVARKFVLLENVKPCFKQGELHLAEKFVEELFSRWQEDERQEVENVAKRNEKIGSDENEDEISGITCVDPIKEYNDEFPALMNSSTPHEKGNFQTPQVAQLLDLSPILGTTTSAEHVTDTFHVVKSFVSDVATTSNSCILNPEEVRLLATELLPVSGTTSPTGVLREATELWILDEPVPPMSHELTFSEVTFYRPMDASEQRAHRHRCLNFDSAFEDSDGIMKFIHINDDSRPGFAPLNASESTEKTHLEHLLEDFLRPANGNRSEDDEICLDDDEHAPRCCIEDVGTYVCSKSVAEQRARFGDAYKMLSDAALRWRGFPVVSETPARSHHAKQYELWTTSENWMEFATRNIYENDAMAFGVNSMSLLTANEFMPSPFEFNNVWQEQTTVEFDGRRRRNWEETTTSFGNIRQDMPPNELCSGNLYSAADENYKKEVWNCVDDGASEEEEEEEDVNLKHFNRVPLRFLSSEFFGRWNNNSSTEENNNELLESLNCRLREVLLEDDKSEMTSSTSDRLPRSFFYLSDSGDSDISDNGCFEFMDSRDDMIHLQDKESTTSQILDTLPFQMVCENETELICGNSGLLRSYGYNSDIIEHHRIKNLDAQMADTNDDFVTRPFTPFFERLMSRIGKNLEPESFVTACTQDHIVSRQKSCENFDEKSSRMFCPLCNEEILENFEQGLCRMCCSYDEEPVYDGNLQEPFRSLYMQLVPSREPAQKRYFETSSSTKIVMDKEPAGIGPMSSFALYTLWNGWDFGWKKENKSEEQYAFEFSPRSLAMKQNFQFQNPLTTSCNNVIMLGSDYDLMMPHQSSSLTDNTDVVDMVGSYSLFPKSDVVSFSCRSSLVLRPNSPIEKFSSLDKSPLVSLLSKNRGSFFSAFQTEQILTPDKLIPQVTADSNGRSPFEDEDGNFDLSLMTEDGSSDAESYEADGTEIEESSYRTAYSFLVPSEASESGSSSNTNTKTSSSYTPSTQPSMESCQDSGSDLDLSQFHDEETNQNIPPSFDYFVDEFSSGDGWKATTLNHHKMCDYEQHVEPITGDENLGNTTECSSQQTLKAVDVPPRFVPSENTAFRDAIPHRLTLEQATLHERTVSPTLMLPLHQQQQQQHQSVRVENVKHIYNPSTSILRQLQDVIEDEDGGQFVDEEEENTRMNSPSRVFRPIDETNEKSVSCCVDNVYASVDVVSEVVRMQAKRSELQEEEEKVEEIVDCGFGCSYQLYLGVESETSFAPKFKVKTELDKSAQTSESTPPIENIDNLLDMNVILSTLALLD